MTSQDNGIPRISVDGKVGDQVLIRSGDELIVLRRSEGATKALGLDGADHPDEGAAVDPNERSDMDSLDAQPDPASRASTALAALVEGPSSDLYTCPDASYSRVHPSKDQPYPMMPPQHRR